MNTFEIRHRTGRLELYTDRFFPCSQKVARYVFKLAKRNCTDDQMKELLQILIDRERFLSMELIELEEENDQNGIKQKKREIERIRSNQLNFVRIITH